eukprot:evm.model.scf_1686EXC.1 EVM.evm.TU.scf_1686EXC.1   scf_1686EXC:13859-22425(+)
MDMRLKNMENKANRLQFQNQRLAEKLEVQKREISALGEKLQRQEEDRKEYQSTVLGINRIWNGLHDDMKCLYSRAKGAEAPSRDARGMALEGLAAAGDPFLVALLSGGPSAKAEAVEEHVEADRGLGSWVEAKLKERTAETLAIFSDCLVEIRSQRQKLSDLAEDAVSRLGESAAQLIGQELRMEAAALRASIDSAEALARAATQRARHAEDRVLQLEHQLKECRDELTDKQGELAAAQRKIVSLKNAAAAGEQVQQLQQQQQQQLQQEQPQPVALQSLPSGSCDLSKQGSLGAPALAELEAQVEEVKQLMRARETELENEKEAHIKTQKELKSLQVTMGSDAWVTENKVFRALSDKKNQLQAQLERRGLEVQTLQNALQREKEALRTKHYDPEMRVRSFEVHQEDQKRLIELQSKLRVAEQRNNDLEHTLQQEKDKMGHSQTVQELKLMVKTLQDELSSKERNFKQQLVTVDELQKSNREAGEAASRVDELDLKLKHLESKLSDRDGEVQVLHEKENRLATEASDLKLFVDVLSTYCGESQSLTELRASERKLKEQVKALELKLQAGSRSSSDGDGELARLRQQLNRQITECDDRTLEVTKLLRENQKLKAEREQAQSMCDVYAQEVEVTGSIYENMQSQNTRLLQQLTEKDEAINQLRGQVMKMTHRTAQLTREVESAKEAQALQRLDVAEVNSIKEEYDRKISSLANDASQCREQICLFESRTGALQLDKQRLESLLEEANVTREALQQKEAELRRTMEEHIELALAEKNRRIKLEQDLKFWQGRGDKAGRSAESTSDLEAQVEAMRMMLNCNVCHRRQKNVVLTTCFHMFCNHCINQRLGSRNRKCPGCGKAFGQHDVSNFYFT